MPFLEYGDNTGTLPNICLRTELSSRRNSPGTGDICYFHLKLAGQVRGLRGAYGDASACARTDIHTHNFVVVVVGGVVVAVFLAMFDVCWYVCLLFVRMRWRPVRPA